MNFKKLALAATAFGLIAGGASAQQATVSVLDRVLGSTANLVSTVAGGASVFANIASTNVDILNAGGVDTIVGNIDGSVTIDVVNSALTTTSGNVNETITNAVDGTTSNTDTTRQEIEAITASLGAISTTVLGAVNTGDMTFSGTVSSIQDDVAENTADAVAGLSTALNEVNIRTSTVTTTMLGDATNPVAMLNIADNVASINGSVGLSIDTANASATGIATTVLGAVNTGTIAQNAAANAAGVVSTITGR